MRPLLRLVVLSAGYRIGGLYEGGNVIPWRLKVFFGLSFVWTLGFLFVTQFLIGILSPRLVAIDLVFFAFGFSVFLSVLWVSRSQ
jgi:hypothetical protein